MLFDRSVRKELARTFGATLVVILTIVITMFLIRTIADAASGSVAPQDVVLLLGYVALGHLPTMLALSLFIAVVLSLGRMYRDSEMAIWFASGVGLSRMVRPVLRSTWPVLVVVALLLLFAWPWGNRMGTELRERYAQRGDLSRVSPGVFQSSRDGKRVFFVERDAAGSEPSAAAAAAPITSAPASSSLGTVSTSANGNAAFPAQAASAAATPASPNAGTLGNLPQARNVFILSELARGESVTSSHTGRLETLAGERYLVLERGQRNDWNRASGERTVSGFESYRVLASEKALRQLQEQPPKAMETLALARSGNPRHQGELTWRLGMLLGAANLLLLGIGLSATNPRRASNWNLMFALMAFAVYYNLVNLSQAWVASGRLSAWAALAVVHGLAFCLALALIWWRDHAAVLRLWPQAKVVLGKAPANSQPRAAAAP